MADYQKDTLRFFFTGLSVLPPDAMPPGKLPYVLNVRSYADGRLRPREGLTSVVSTLGAPVHTLARLNDPTEFNGGVPAVRIVGAGSAVYRGIPSNTSPSSVASGFSGDPLTTFSAQPPRSPRPWQYLADVDTYQKFQTDGSSYAVGLAQPGPIAVEPTVTVGKIQKSAHDILSSTAWTSAGTAASGEANIERVDTTISQIVYDDTGTNIGYCSIVPADSINITTGTLLTVGNPSGFFDNEIVTDITIAIAPTTVDAIIYDSGSSGLCTIQPVGSLGTGQLDAPPIDAYRRRAFNQQGTAYAVPRGESGGIPPKPDPTDPVRRIRQMDFPVDCLIELGGEVVRILSVAIGTDGVQSFRCRTSGTVGAGATITGLPAIRIWLPTTHAAGERLTRPGISNTLTYPAPLEDRKAAMTGGIKGTFAMTLAQFENGEAVLPEDELHVAVNVNRLTEVLTVRVYIDVDQTTNDFLQNYYFHEWRASDIIASIQATNAAQVTPLITARATVVANHQLETPNSGHATPRSGNAGNAPSRSSTTANAQRQRQPIAQTATSTQLGLGNNQWVDLRVKIGTLIRAGTDPTRTLANAKAFEILLSCEGPQENVTPSPLTVKYSDLQIYGGSGPDVGEVGDPYVYCYRYRSSLTGAVSNPSPAFRGGVIPRRQPVDLEGTPSSDPQVDKIDWFRLGGALTAWTYVGTGDNSTDAYTDRFLDSAIDGGEILSFTNFQPWPLQDRSQTGVCNVAGTAVSWVSGDTFDTNWAPGSLIIVNGQTTTLYASPSSSTLLHLVDNVGAASSVDFTLTGPTILSQPLRSAWGDLQGFYFACGDQFNPGTLYWSQGNNPEATTDANSLIVTTPSQPLMGGGIYNTFGFVFSSDDLFSLIIQPGATTPIRAIKTPCGRGAWTPWSFCVGTEGIFFLSGDGIYLTAGGSPSVCLTTDLKAIFPHDGVPGQSANGIPVPDMTQTERLRLSYIGTRIYFDFLDTDAVARTLYYELDLQRWFLDASDLTGLTVRNEELGAGVYDQIIGGANGAVYQYDEDALTDAGTDISFAVHTTWTDGGRPRTVKQFGDVGFDFDAGGGLGVTVTPVTEDGQTALTPQIKGASDTGRQSYIVDINNGLGVLTRNFGIQIAGTVGGGRASLYWWEPAFLFKADDTARRATDWSNEGYVGAKFVQGVLIRANTYGVDKLVQVQKDGGETAITLTINHDGEEQIAYPLASVGWDPFVTELIRLVGADDVDWQILDVKFIYEPAPELATQWETQFTSHDLPGYLSVHDMVIGYEATQPITLTLTYDDRVLTQTIPATGGAYKRLYLLICPNKAKAVKYQWKTAEPARIYKHDLSVRVQGWGLPGGYMVKSPFGGPSRADGAAI